MVVLSNLLFFRAIVGHIRPLLLACHVVPNLRPRMRAASLFAICAVIACAAAAVPGRSHRGTRFVPKSTDARTAATDALRENAARRLSTSPFFNVEDYGAKGDNSTDNAGPFATALAAAAAVGGGTVLIPAGLFVFKGNINIPSGVNLKGSYATVPSHQMVGGGAPPSDGTVLQPLIGGGNENGTAFITVNEDSTFAGCVIFYPLQASVQLPVPYPYTIYMTGNNAAVTDVELLNSYNGIQAVQAHRHYIARVQGQVRAQRVDVCGVWMLADKRVCVRGVRVSCLCSLRTSACLWTKRTTSAASVSSCCYGVSVVMLMMMRSTIGYLWMYCLLPALTALAALTAVVLTMSAFSCVQRMFTSTHGTRLRSLTLAGRR